MGDGAVRRRGATDFFGSHLAGIVDTAAGTMSMGSITVRDSFTPREAQARPALSGAGLPSGTKRPAGGGGGWPLDPQPADDPTAVLERGLWIVTAEFSAEWSTGSGTVTGQVRTTGFDDLTPALSTTGGTVPFGVVTYESSGDPTGSRLFVDLITSGDPPTFASWTLTAYLLTGLP